MKYFTVAALLFCFLPCSVQAGSVASKSLISSHQGNRAVWERSAYNPAVLGFNKQVVDISLEVLEIQAVSWVLELSDVNLTYKPDDFYYNLRIHETMQPVSSILMEGRTLSVGWMRDAVSIAAYTTNMVNQTGRDDNHLGIGVCFALEENFFVGMTRATGSGNQFDRSFGVAYRIEKKFRIEYSLSYNINDLGAAYGNNALEVEYQWAFLVFGLTAREEVEPGVLHKFTTFYLGYEPEQSGFSISLGTLDSSVTGFTEATHLSMGYSF